MAFALIRAEKESLTATVENDRIVCDFPRIGGGTAILCLTSGLSSIRIFWGILSRAPFGAINRSKHPPNAGNRRLFPIAEPNGILVHTPMFLNCRANRCRILKRMPLLPEGEGSPHFQNVSRDVRFSIERRFGRQVERCRRPIRVVRHALWPRSRR